MRITWPAGYAQYLHRGNPVAGKLSSSSAAAAVEKRFHPSAPVASYGPTGLQSTFPSYVQSPKAPSYRPGYEHDKMSNRKGSSHSWFYHKHDQRDIAAQRAHQWAGALKP